MQQTKRALKNNLVRMAIGIAVLMVGAFSFQNCGKFESKDIQLQTPLGSEGVKNAGLEIHVGIMRPTAAGIAAGSPIEGRMLFVRDPASGSQVYISANGAIAGTMYMAHVHNQVCWLGGGTHYKIDNSISAAVENNEIWPALTIGTDGLLSGYVSSPHLARPEAQSVVVHAMDNTRLACGSFFPQYSTTQKSGSWQTLPGGVTQGRTVSGSGTLIRNGSGAQTVLRLVVGGLAPTTAYTAHVHNQACASAEGGVHYKLNPAVTEVTASSANEIWATFTTDAAGFAEARTVVNGHVAQPDALSVVIHDPVTPATRLACLDLSADGGFVSFTAGLQRTRNVTGTASLDRLPTGQTVVTVTANGLVPNTAYVPHVHKLPCHVQAAGTHYLLNPNNQAGETNEIWPRFTTDATGRGTGTLTVNHLARPDAQAIVIHDPVDSTKIACVDLY